MSFEKEKQELTTKNLCFVGVLIACGSLGFVKLELGALWLCL